MSRVVVSRVVLAVLLLALSACQADVRVDLDVEADGSGLVSLRTELDESARTTLGELETQLRVSDLERAGWDITTTPSETSTEITATKQVASSTQWQGVLDEILGPGVFNDVAVGIDDNRQSISFGLDLDRQWDLLSDEGVAEALDGERFGAPLETLTGGRTIDDIVALELQVSVRNFDDADPTVRTFTPRFDQGPLTVQVESTAENSAGVLLRWVAIALFALFALATVLAVTGLVLQRRADRLRPDPTPGTLASRVPGAGTTEAAVSPAPPVAPRNETVRLVVVEALAVLYRQAHPFDDHVLPFIRDHGGSARADTIADGYRSVLTGSMDTASFWELCGVEGDHASLDAEFVDGRKLGAGIGSFLSEMQRRRIPVAATTNDAATWSTAARDRDRLRGIWPWLVSSDVGATTDNMALFEVLRRESSIAHSHCLYVDTDITNLDAAAALGMKTALFDTGDLDLPPVVGHPVVDDLDALFGATK